MFGSVLLDDDDDSEQEHEELEYSTLSFNWVFEIT